MSPDEMVCSRTVVAIPLQKALLMCPYISSGKFSVLAPRCSCALFAWFAVYIWLLFNFCKPYGYQNDSCICHHFSPLCLQETCGSFTYFPENALLSFCRNMKSAVHVPYAGWFKLSCSALARTHDFKNFMPSIQGFCCKTFTMLWYDTSYRCLCVQSSMSCGSPLCHHLDTFYHIIAWVCLFVSKHL